MKSKACRKCGAEKDVTAFYKEAAQADLYSETCKECCKAELSTTGAIILFVFIISARPRRNSRVHLSRPDLLLPICVIARKFARRGGRDGNTGAWKVTEAVPTCARCFAVERRVVAATRPPEGDGLRQ
jgi:hypothetical protein